MYTRLCNGNYIYISYNGKMDRPAFSTANRCIFFSLAQSIPSHSSEGTSSGGPESTASSFQKKSTGPGGWWSENVWNIVQAVVFGVFPPFSPGIGVENTNDTGWPMQMNMFSNFCLLVSKWHDDPKWFGCGYGLFRLNNLPWVKVNQCLWVYQPSHCGSRDELVFFFLLWFH